MTGDVIRGNKRGDGDLESASLGAHGPDDGQHIRHATSIYAGVSTYGQSTFMEGLETSCHRRPGWTHHQVAVLQVEVDLDLGTGSCDDMCCYSTHWMVLHMHPVAIN